MKNATNEDFQSLQTWRGEIKAEVACQNSQQDDDQHRQGGGEDQGTVS